MSKPRNRLVAMVREPVTVAIFTAILVTGVLAFAVLTIWTGAPGSNGPETDLGIELAAMTPTPRTIRWPGSSPATSPSPSSASVRRRSSPAVTNIPAINLDPTGVPAISPPSPTVPPLPAVEPEPTAETTPTPIPSAVPTATAAATPTAPPTPNASPPPSPTPEPEFEADNATTFAPLVAGRWTVAGDQLVSNTPQALAEPWLLVPYQVESGDFAIEAEIRVDGLAPDVCNETFGVILGSQLTGQFWGGGVFYPCGDLTRIARITDVSNWTDGYDADRLLAEADFNPDEGWHTYRLEVRGNEFRLLIDGDEVLTAADTAVPAGISGGQAGLWTQGAQLTVRRLAIYDL